MFSATCESITSIPSFQRSSVKFAAIVNHVFY
jgi:hypothetical protein